MCFYDKDRNVKPKQKAVRISSSGNGKKELSNLTDEEMDLVEGMVCGQYFLTVNENGRLEAINRREELPSPIKDVELLPFWRTIANGHAQLELFKVPIERYSLPDIIIRHLCGYHYSPENYVIQAERLESYGFECLRSRRGRDGRFDEAWMLHSLWSAKGDLATAISEKKDYKVAISFLCNNVIFGTLDIAFQRAAMPIPD